MSDLLNEYLKHSCCFMKKCPYGKDVKCSDCNEKMLAEHDKQVRADAIDECIKFIKDHSTKEFIDCDGYWGCSQEEVFKLDWLDDLEQLKERRLNDE